MPGYRPINCEFHDVLEALATTRRPARIEFVHEDGSQGLLVGVIQDVYARDGAEYLALGSGETVRLDQLIAVNGSRETDF